MKIKREIVTPYLVFIFIVVALSGMLMFFPLFDDYTNVVHEFLRLAFPLSSILYIMNDWKSVANYSKKQQLIFPSTIILIISSTLLFVGKGKGNLENNILNKSLQYSVSVTFKVLDVEFEPYKKHWDRIILL